MFVTAANFDGLRYNLPKLSEYGNNLQAFIDEVEEEALRCLLGNERYTDFIEGIEETYPDQKWIDLRDGETFEGDDTELVWVGMEKMLTPLVYSQLVELTHRKHTGIGATISKMENAIGINPVEDVVRGNNDYVDHAHVMLAFLKEGDYGVLDEYSYCVVDGSVKITHKKKKPCFPKYRNTFGI